MKVVHLGNVPVPAGHPEASRVKTHAGRWVLNHAIAQKAAGLDVEVVAQAHKATRDFDCEIGGVTVHFLRTFHPYRHFTLYALDAWRMARFVRGLAPDVVHAHGTEAAYGHAAVQSGLPFCVTAQGLFFKIIPALGRSPTLTERFLRAGEDAVWSKTRFAIAKSEYGVAALRGQFPHLQVALIHNAYDAELESPVRERDGKRIAFVGTITPRKGFHDLVPVAKKMLGDTEFEFHVAGNAPEGQGGKYEIANVAELRRILGPRLVLHGTLAAPDLFAMLDRCRVIAVPSYEEMSGNQATEGLMRGCHAVVYAGTGVAGIVSLAGNSTLVQRGNAAAFADAVQAALSATPAPSDVETARLRIHDLMSPPAVAAKHAEFYMKILSASGRRQCA